MECACVRALNNGLDSWLRLENIREDMLHLGSFGLVLFLDLATLPPLHYVAVARCSAQRPFTQFVGVYIDSWQQWEHHFSALNIQPSTFKMKDVIGYLKQQQSKSPTPEMASVWHSLEDLYNRKYECCVFSAWVWASWVI